MAEIRVRREEGHYTIKRVPKLPKKGNANWLYAIIGDSITEFYRWNLKNEWETISLGGGGTNLQAGANVTVTGTGDVGDPFIISSTDTLPTAFEAFEGGIRRIGSTTTNRYTIGPNTFDGTLYDAGFVGAPDTPAPPFGSSANGSFMWGTNNKDEGDFENVTIGGVNSTNAFAYSSIIGGYNVAGFGYGDTLLGTYNTINPGNVNSFLFAIGHNVTVNSRFGGGGLGLGLVVNGDGEVAVGKANAPWTGADNAADRYAFVVGTGATTTPAGRWIPTVQKNGFIKV